MLLASEKWCREAGKREELFAAICMANGRNDNNNIWPLLRSSTSMVDGYTAASSLVSVRILREKKRKVEGQKATALLLCASPQLSTILLTTNLSANNVSKARVALNNRTLQRSLPSESSGLAFTKYIIFQLYWFSLRAVLKNVNVLCLTIGKLNVFHHHHFWYIPWEIGLFRAFRKSQKEGWLIMKKDLPIACLSCVKVSTFSLPCLVHLRDYWQSPFAVAAAASNFHAAWWRRH